MSNLYVSLEEVKNHIDSMVGGLYPVGYEYHSEAQLSLIRFKEELKYLPTINLSIIDEMIEENKNASDYMCDKLAGPVRDFTLQELKQRLSPNN